MNTYTNDGSATCTPKTTGVPNLPDSRDLSKSGDSVRLKM